MVHPSKASVHIHTCTLTHTHLQMIHYLSFCVWLISLSIVFSSFIHIIVFIGIFFLFMAEYYSSDVYTTVCLSTDGHLVFFHLLALVNSAMSMGIQL